MILAVFGKCELAIRCVKCGETFAVKPVVDLFDLTAADAKAIGLAIAPKSSMHVCKRPGAA